MRAFLIKQISKKSSGYKSEPVLAGQVNLCVRQLPPYSRKWVNPLIAERNKNLLLKIKIFK
jgi:hypothetical protein